MPFILFKRYLNCKNIITKVVVLIAIIICICITIFFKYFYSYLIIDQDIEQSPKQTIIPFKASSFHLNAPSFHLNASSFHLKTSSFHLNEDSTYYSSISNLSNMNISPYKILHNLDTDVYNNKHNRLYQMIVKTDQMLNELSISSIDEQCSIAYGLNFLDFWHSNHMRICSSPPPYSKLPNIRSEIECYLLPDEKDQTRTPQSAWFTLCRTFRSQINWKLFQSENRSGALKAYCDPTMLRNIIQTKHIFPTIVGKWFIDSLEDKERNKLVCDFNHDMKVNDQPFFFLHRWSPSNYYHQMEDFVTTFMSFALLNIDPIGDNLKIIITDGWIENDSLFKDVWLNLFTGYSNRSKWKNTNSKNAKNGYLFHVSPYNGKMAVEYNSSIIECFSQTIHNVHGGVSLLSYKRYRTKGIQFDSNCRSSIITAFSYYFLHSFNILPGFQRTQIKMEQTSIPCKILFISRVKNTSYPFSGESHSNIHRELVNERDFLLNIQTKIDSFDSSEFQQKSEISVCQKWILERIVLEQHSIAEQIEITSNAEIVIGVHGAGLTHVITMNGLEDGGSYLIEIFCGDRRRVNTHYAQIAFRKGVKYDYTSFGSGVCKFNFNRNVKKFNVILLRAMKFIHIYRSQRYFTEVLPERLKFYETHGL